MSRRSKTRRKARKARTPSQRNNPVGWTEPWGSGPPLTPEERARVLSRYRDMRSRGVTIGFVPTFADVFEARTPEELNEAIRQRLLKKAKGQLES